MDHIFDENRPIYLQIKHRICAQILRGEFKPGDRLPGVIDAAMFYKVNHNTIQRVYQDMVREGVAVSRRGEGTFVTGDTAALEGMRRQLQESYLEDFIQQMWQFGCRDEEIVQAVRSYVNRKKKQ